jgi:glyoxylase-like metal-dependent hydrolase (beta-lactamase superfamily II)
MAFRYLTVPVTHFQQNCSIVWCDDTGRAAVIDPGGDLPKLIGAADALGVRLEQIWLTHAHVDHAGGSGELARTLGLPITGPQEEDRFWINALPQQGVMFDFPPAEPFEPDRWLQDGDTVRIGHCELEVMHCPGHTPGHVVFFERQTKTAFVGDVIFSGSIGRTDFPRGDYAALVNSIVSKLWPLGDDVRFVPGHGPQSTFGHERRHNPYVGGT